MASRAKRVIDVNALAVFLVEDHPGNQYVTSTLEEGLRGAYIPVIMDIIPIRAYWIMTKRWKCPEDESAEAIKHFLREYDQPQYPSLTRQTMVEGFNLAEQLGHDVFDCVYVAFALQEGADAIVTTDTNFEKLCERSGLDYVNPVPLNILKRFREFNK